MHSKTLILSSLKQYPSNTPRAIVTFINNSNSISGKIRLYNIHTLEDGVKMGIYIDGEVKTLDLTPRLDSYEFNLSEKIDLEKDVYCALINTKKSNEVVLCGGSYAGYFSSNEDEVEVFTPSLSSNSVDVKKDETKGAYKNLDELNEDENFNAKTILNQERDETCNKDCANCEYKKFFYEHQNLEKQKDAIRKEELKSCNLSSMEQNDDLKDRADKNIQINNENIKNQNENSNEYQNDETVKNDELNKTQILEASENNENTENKNDLANADSAENFLSLISEQLDEMFNRYPLDDTIMKIIPNSRIIKVTDSVDGNPYILGVMYENDAIRYLVYGVPSNYNTKAPDELGENYNWLPLDVDNPYDDGYYLIYQDASTGKLVPVKVE